LIGIEKTTVDGHARRTRDVALSRLLKINEKRNRHVVVAEAARLHRQALMLG
jgi:hypothetical protein